MKTHILRSILAVVCVVSSLFVSARESPVSAETVLDPANLRFTQVTQGLAQPVLITHAGDGSGRLFVVERAGRIRIVKNGALLSTPFLDIDPIVHSSSSEQGLLALAFHPGYGSNGQFYTVHTPEDGSLVLSSFTRSASDPDLADASSISTILSIPHPGNTNHNGGTLAFGPDGYLYWSTGDGGGGGDVPNNAQNLTVLLGKILRLDVDSGSPYGIPSSNPFVGHPTPNIREEIWAYGLRNPWRFSFDSQTGDLFIGDVGQGAREEINFQAAASAGGENYGWRVMEGSLCFNPSSGCDQSGKVLPIAEYNHSVGCSVTGGYVYRGSLFPLLRGHYFYGDFCTGAFFSLDGSGAGGWSVTPLGDTPYSISTFGEDEAGELYLADYGTGRIYQLGYTTFADVPVDHIFHRYIEGFYNAGITAGCSVSPASYCPASPVTRGEMAVFIERAMGNFSPAPSPSGMFTDLPASHPFTPFIEELYNDGITAGCSTSPLMYCPNSPVTRGQMAVFIERALGNFSPTPSPSDMFADVSPTDPFKPFIEELYNNGITAGCSTNPLNYCPEAFVTRGEMAVFLTRAFNIPLP
ncbi:MAG TPA: PQQ-dependent sugar dehydrogenase [Anaerolineales bacterium]|nr:PQQ-dependent sugar dehydrogenase [Anaerolineales bacterium]